MYQNWTIAYFSALPYKKSHCTTPGVDYGIDIRFDGCGVHMHKFCFKVLKILCVLIFQRILFTGSMAMDYDTGLKFYSVWSSPLTLTWSISCLSLSSKLFKILYFLNPRMHLIYIWFSDKYLPHRKFILYHPHQRSRPRGYRFRNLMLKFCIQVFKVSSFLNFLMQLVYIWYVQVYYMYSGRNNMQDACATVPM